MINKIVKFRILFGMINKIGRECQSFSERSRSRRQQSADEVRLTAERYYWQTVTLQEKLLTLRALEAQLGRIGTDVEAAAGAGVATRNDLLQSNVRAAELEERIATGKNLQSAENLRVHEAYYRAGTTMSDLLDAQTLYRRSCDRFTDAYAAFRVSTTEYLVATGR